MKLIPWIVNDDFEAYTTTTDSNNESFNMSFNGINDEEVLNNRKELAKQLNTSLDYMIAPLQQHTNYFKEVSYKDRGKGAYCKESSFIGYDALYTKDKNIWLMTFHADCTPVLIYCEDKKIIAAIHSGWKGTMKQIVSHVVKHLIDKEHVDPTRIHAYIGPSINKEQFEAKDDIIEQVKRLPFDTSTFYIKKDDGAYLLDHKGLIQQQLLQLGLQKENIEISPLCTIKNEDLFFSYRRKKSPHRNITLIAMK